MVFSSSVFLFLFLPIFLAVYYWLPERRRTLWILLASYAFYGWWRLDFLALFAGTTLFTFLVGRLVSRLRSTDEGRARLALALGVAGNAATLAYFKYFNFGVESLDALLVRLGSEPLGAPQVLLPIGISFYVFQSISYLVDIWRRDAPDDRGFVDVAAYIALFPQLIAGPIVRFKVLAPQLRQPGGDLGSFSDGSLRFMIGFCKKVLVADAVAPIADAAFALDEPTAVDAWLGALAYAIQLFFDFSGYSDMAIGLGLMMGFRFLENFDRPYVSRSITEFWRRWHISLSRWLRDYLYIPLGGNRRGRRRTYLNLALVMLLGGLWHGAAWTFVLWGAWHGGLLIVERLLHERGWAIRLPGPVAIARTFLFVVLGWVTFRADGIAGALGMYRAMLGANGVGPSSALLWQLPLSGLAVLALAYLLVWWPWARDRSEDGAAVTHRLPATLAIAPLFLLGVLRLTADSFSPFLYFRF